MIIKTAISRTERAIVPFVRLLAIITLVVTLGSCSLPHKYKGRVEAIATAKANIQQSLVHLGVEKINAVDEYIGVENGITYYFILLRVQTEQAVLFATVKLSIQSDMSVRYATYVIVHGGD